MYTIKWAAELTGIGMPTLRAWERRYGVVSPARSPGHYRLYSDADVRALSIMAALVRDGWAASAAAAETLRRLGSADAEQRQAEEETLAAVERASPEGVDEILEAARHLDGARLAAALDRGMAGDDLDHMADWLMPVLWAVGQAWADGRITVAGEHLVSNSVARRLAVLYQGEPRTTTGPLVVLGLPSGTRHELGLLAFAVGLRRAGVRTAYLGADLPAEEWAGAVSGHGAAAAVLAVPSPDDVAPAQAVIDRIIARAPGVLVAAGGRHQRDVTGALALGHDHAEGVAALRAALRRRRTRRTT